MSSSFTSISGLNAAGQLLGVVSNNIANAGSLGFKRSITSFKDVYSTTPSQMNRDFAGSGVADGVTKQIFTQGSLQSTQNMLNMAISGQGFFAVTSALTKTPNYTRSGNFSLDPNNWVVNEDGDQLMAASVDKSGNVLNGLLSPLKIPPKTVGQYKTSTQLKQALTLPSDSKIVTGPFDRNNPATYTSSNAIDLIDDYGRSRQGRIFYIKTQDPSTSDPYGQWKTILTVDGQVIPPTVRSYTKSAQANKASGDQFIEWSGTGDSRDVLNIASDQKASTDKGVMTVVDNKIYQGNGSSAVEVGVIDPVKNGQGGNPLRINWTSQKFEMGGFEAIGSSSEPLPGWTIVDSPIKLDGVSQIAGWPTPIDMTTPLGSPGELDSGTSGSFVISRSGSGGKDGAGAVLTSTGSVGQPYGILRGPAIVSNQSVAIPTNGQVSFDWKAISLDDTYDVYGYLLNTDTGETQKLFDQTGAHAGQNSEWIHVSANVAKAGNYKFVFLGGAYDITGGQSDKSNPVDLGDTKALTQKIVNGGAMVNYISGLVSLSYIPSGITDLALTVDGYPGAEDDIQIFTKDGKHLMGTPVLGNKADAVWTQKGITSSEQMNSQVLTTANGFLPSATYDESLLPVNETTFDTSTMPVVNQYNGMTLRWSGDGDRSSGENNDGFTNLSIEKLTIDKVTEDLIVMVVGSGIFGVQASWNDSKLGDQNKPKLNASFFIDNIQTQQTLDINIDFLDSKVSYIQTLDDTEGILRFDRAGKLDPALAQINYDVPYSTGTSLTYDLTDTRALNAKYAVNSSSQNGLPEGTLESLDVAPDGLVKATFSNGNIQKLGKILLANFNNPSGLSQLGDSRYKPSAESGPPVFSEAGVNGMGNLRAGSLEMSNVDVTTELVDLIVAQRNFQANAKAIEMNQQMIKSMADNIR